MVTPPLIVIEGHDIGIYADVAFTLGDLEAIDVQKETYRVFDAEGRLVKLVAEKNRVVLSTTEEEPQYRLELEAALRGFLIVIGMPKMLADGMSLPQLLEESARYATVDPNFTLSKGICNICKNIMKKRTEPKWVPMK